MSEQRAAGDRARADQDSLLRQGALWCDNHRIFPPRCQECGRTFVRISMDRDQVARVDPDTGPICTRCAKDTEGCDVARGVGPGCVNWNEPGVYGELPLIDEAAELWRQEMGPTAIAHALNERHGLALTGHQVGQTVRKWERGNSNGNNGGAGQATARRSRAPPRRGRGAAPPGTR